MKLSFNADDECGVANDWIWKVQKSPTAHGLSPISHQRQHRSVHLDSVEATFIHVLAVPHEHG